MIHVITGQYLARLRKAAEHLKDKEMNDSEKALWDEMVKPSEVIRLLDEMDRIAVKSEQQNPPEAA